ncbi:flagellar assembly protein FliH [Salicola sp. Rm-C-2C1-2]|uniref:flagellar assembly protein FliH n=1 Tax=Salicola sp. Rm-C-2C1-2 TaxID=3141321 RepID=UPI0032E42862
MTRHSHRDRIPSGDLTAYERWEMPLLDENGQRRAGVEEVEQKDVQPLTAEQLEAIHNEARDEGYNAGFESGKTEGMDQGAREGYRVGYDEGHAAGREAGEQQGHEEGHERVRQQEQRLQQIMDALVRPIRQEEEAAEAALLNLVMALSRSVIHRELQFDSSQVASIVRQAIQSLPDSDTDMRIRVHPDDAEMVRQAVEGVAGNATVVPDEHILPGGCTVGSSRSLVDYTVEKRFQKQVQRMLETRLSDSDEGERSELGAVMGEMSDYHRDVLESDDGPEAGNGDDNGAL